MLKPQENWIDILAPGIAGWNIFLESEAIEDQELSEVSNMVYDGGYISPRPGSSLFAAKPTQTSNAPSQLFENVSTSDGIEYIVAWYGDELYFYHPLVADWVQLNQTYTPTETDTEWGYINWNNGRGDDRLYMCNGVDSFIRWDMALSTVVANETAGSTVVVEVADGTRFPTGGGTVVIGSGGSERKETYNSRSGNNLTFNTLGANITAGEAITMEAVEKSGMEKGKVMTRHQSRLFVANRFGAETSGFYSVTNAPENFTTGSTITAASSFTIADGNGGITSMSDFGAFLLIEKEDSLHRFEIVTADNLGSKLDKIQPIVSGTSVGTISQSASVKTLNQLFYPTRTEGFINLDPRTSGDSASTGLNVISRKIQPYVTRAIDLDKCKGTVYRQNILWAVGRPDAEANTLVLMYDTLRDSWSLFENWAVNSWARANKKLYFLENETGDVYQCYTDSYNDENNPYPCSFTTKRFNFGVVSRAKVQDSIYVQGYITPASDIFVDVLFNEDGLLGTQTFRINKDTEGLLYTTDIGGMLGSEELSKPMLGAVSLENIGDLGFFRGYLGLDNSKGFYNMQIRFRSNKEAFWAITGVGLNPEVSPTTDPSMYLSPFSEEGIST